MKKTSSIIKIAGFAMLLLVVAAVSPASAAQESGGAVYKINPDGTQTLVESYDGTGVTVTATVDTDGKVKIVKENGKPAVLGERSIHQITSSSTLPEAVDNGNSGGGASKIAATQSIDALAAVTYYSSSAKNNVIGVSCYAYSGNYYGYAGTEAGTTSSGISYCNWWAA